MAFLLVYALLPRPPQRGRGNLREVAAVGVLAGYLGDLPQQPVAQSSRFEAQVEETIVADVQVVLGRLVARVGHVVYLRARAIGDQRGQVVLVVVGEQELILGLGHVVDPARVRRVEDLLLYDLAPISLDLDRQVPFGDLHPGRTVTVDAHGPEMHDVGVEPALGDRREQVVGGVEVVVHGVALVIAGLHRVGCGPLLGEVDDRVRLPLEEQVQKLLVVLGDVDVVEVDPVAGQLLPDAQALAHRTNRGEGLTLQLDVYLAPGEVVDNCHLVALRREVQRGWPAAKAVAAQNEYLHLTRSLLALRYYVFYRLGSSPNQARQPAIVAENVPKGTNRGLDTPTDLPRPGLIAPPGA